MISPVQLRDAVSQAARTNDPAEIERLSAIVAGMIDLDLANSSQLGQTVSQVINACRP